MNRRPSTEPSQFVERYGGIYEHSPWVAQRVEAFLNGDRVDAERLPALMADVVDNASVEQQLALIRAHPDLAGKAAVAGELTTASNEEQSSAGLDRCTAEEYATLTALNETYRDKFDFPFIMAVRQSTRAQIIAAFTGRVANSYDQEFETALQEIHSIARMRLAAMDVT